MFRPFDAERTPIEGTMLLEASAGTGKTYALERIAARLIAGGRGIDEILVVTFTNRAAREMKERIRALLARRVREEGRDEGERERYRRALGGFDSAAIFTIHGFCRMVLSTWPFEASAPFSQELAADSAVEAAEARFWLAGLDESSVDLTLLGAAWREGGSAESLIGRLPGCGRRPGNRRRSGPCWRNHPEGRVPWDGRLRRFSRLTGMIRRFRGCSQRGTGRRKRRRAWGRFGST